MKKIIQQLTQNINMTLTVMSGVLMILGFLLSFSGHEATALFILSL